MIARITMPNKHAAIKDLRKNRKHAAHNAKIKMNVKQLLKQAQTLITAGKLKEAREVALKLQQAVDKAAKNHVLHKNKASRVNAMIMSKVK